MKKAVIILSHCNTEEKLQVLKDNISKLKSNPDLDIILTSHISLPKEVVDSVNYFVYDKNNPVLSWPQRGMFSWKEYNKIYLNSIQPDYGWCVFNQIKLGGLMALDYDTSYIINYDLVIDLNVNEILNNNIQETNFFQSKNYQGEVQNPSLLLFKVNKPHLQYLINNISIDDYCNSHKTAEQYLNTLIQNLEHTIPDYFVFDQIDFFDKQIFKLSNSIYSHFDYFVTDFDFSPWYHNDKGEFIPESTYFYNIKESITIKYKDIIQVLSPNQNHLIKSSECYYKQGNDWILLNNPTPNVKQYITANI
tara:strand:+ start:292 stop:1209 length:918 start_codon:yes stop_codon:yes gene_type:complete